MSIENGYRLLCTGSLAVLTILAVLCLVRCIIGPRISDRIMSVNMVSTLTIIMVGVFTVFLKEGYLADVAMVYAVLSFLAVIVLCKVYTGVYRERKHAQQNQDDIQQEAESQEAE